MRRGLVFRIWTKTIESFVTFLSQVSPLLAYDITHEQNMIHELDGVGPVDNRPSSMTLDIIYGTCDT